MLLSLLLPFAIFTAGFTCANILKGLTKARHPVAKAVAKATGQTPVRQEVSKKRSCSSPKQACAFTQGGESATLRKGAPILASLQNASTKKRRSPEEPRTLPLRPISTCKRYSGAARAQSPARRGRLKPAAGLSPRHRHAHEGSLGSASRPRLAKSQLHRPQRRCCSGAAASRASGGRQASPYRASAKWV